MEFVIRPIEKEDALIISKWQYPEPYSIYSFDGSERCINELLDGSYYSVFNDSGELIGYFCFGVSAQVPVGNNFGAYSQPDFVDIGLGMNPAFCGQGKGLEFFYKGLDFARERFSNNKFRLTVATFNKRAIRVYENAGFKKEILFERMNDNRRLEFMTMIAYIGKI